MDICNFERGKITLYSSTAKKLIQVHPKRTSLWHRLQTEQGKYIRKFQLHVLASTLRDSTNVPLSKTAASRDEEMLIRYLWRCKEIQVYINRQAAWNFRVANLNQAAKFCDVIHMGLIIAAFCFIILRVL